MPSMSDLRGGSAAPERPLLRGRLHQMGFFVAIPAGATLVVLARGATARFGALVYAMSLLALFASSAAYHRLKWSPPALRRMRKLDHSMIYVLIAGTYTPFTLIALDGWWRIGMLVTAWTGATVGIVLKLVKIDGLRVLAGTMYIVLGWAIVLAMPQMVRELHPAAVALLATGGILYTVGAVMFFRKRPDPSPRVFGYHEIWHSMTLGATVCHYTAVLMLVRAVR